MKEQPTTGVTSFFFHSPFLMKNGYYAELNETWKFREYTYTHFNIVNHHETVILCITHNMNTYTCSV